MQLAEMSPPPAPRLSSLHSTLHRVVMQTRAGEEQETGMRVKDTSWHTIIHANYKHLHIQGLLWWSSG